MDTRAARSVPSQADTCSKVIRARLGHNHMRNSNNAVVYYHFFASHKPVAGKIVNDSMKWYGLAERRAGASLFSMATIGIIGAGKIGSQLARLAVKNGHRVVIANSREPATLSGLVAELGPNARAATATEAGAAGEIVVVTVPLKNYRAIPVEPLAGKVVIDTNNYYPQRDGHILELDNESSTTAELLQAHLPTSKVVKAFNHIYAAALTVEGQPAGSKNRRALVIAGDDQAAKATVSRLIDQFGFDVVDAGPLKEGWRIQRDTPGYGPRRNAADLRRDLAAAKRYADQ